MNDSVFERLGNKPVQQQHTPKSAVFNRLKEMGIDVPKGMENDPNALLKHVMQSGRVPQNRLSIAQSMMRNMFKRY